MLHKKTIVYHSLSCDGCGQFIEMGMEGYDLHTVETERPEGVQGIAANRGWVVHSDGKAMCPRCAHTLVERIWATDIKPNPTLQKSNEVLEKERIDTWRQDLGLSPTL